MYRTSSFGVLVFVVILALGAAGAYAQLPALAASIAWLAGAFLLALIASRSIRVAAPWDRAVVLRLGRFRGLRGPGLFFIVPVIDTIAYWIDTRVITSSFKAEKTLTKDTVPVDVDAVLFWKVIDPQKAALAVADYTSAISWASQTALRDVIGKTLLSEMLEGRSKISTELQQIIDERTEPWGVNVLSVEVRDVLIPTALQDAMSMQAQAERERQSRRHPRRFGASGRGEIRRGREDLRQRPNRLALARNEHALRGPQAKCDDRPRAELGAGDDAARRTRGNHRPDGCPDEQRRQREA